MAIDEVVFVNEENQCDTLPERADPTYTTTPKQTTPTTTPVPSTEPPDGN